MYQDDKYINDLRPEKNHLLVHDEENISHSLFEWCQLLEHKEQTILLNEDGIDAETLKKTFDPFFTTKPMSTGTGLGLSLSYGIIQKHNGHITLDSVPGKGTCFHIELPIAQVEQRSEVIANQAELL